MPDNFEYKMDKHLSMAKNIIDKETLEKLYSVQDKKLEKVICYLWLNQVKQKESIDVIDAVEFIFSDEEKLILTGNEFQEGLCVTEYNFEAQKEIIDKEFQGKIKIFKVDASKTEMWKDVITKKLSKIRLTKDKQMNAYLSDEIVMEFENHEMRLIKVHPLDGVILDYFEEID